MKIFICIKQVPDPNTTISKLDLTTKRLVRSGVSLVLDPGDESTISAAIKLRDYSRESSAGIAQTRLFGLLLLSLP